MGKKKKDFPAITFEFRDNEMHMDHVAFTENKMSMWHLFQTWLLIADLIIVSLKDSEDSLKVSEKMVKALKLFEIEQLENESND